MKARSIIALAIIHVSVLALVLFAPLRLTSANGACTDPLGCVTVGPNEPVHIAHVLAITGTTAFVGIDERNGVEIAIDDAGGRIAGHDIQFDGVNGGCDEENIQEIGQAAGETLAADASIIAVIGPTCSPAAQVIAPILSQAGFVIVSPSSTAPSLTDPESPDYHPGFLRTIYNDRVQGSVAADFVRGQLGIVKVATLRENTLFSNSLEQIFVDRFTALGGTIIAREIITSGQTDIGAVLSQIAAGEPDLLYFPVFLSSGIDLINRARATPGLEDVYLMGADVLYRPDVVDATGANIEGFLVTCLDPTQYSAEYFDSFLPAYREKFGDPLDLSPWSLHAYAYDAFMLIRAAIERVAVVYPDGSLQIGRQALRDAMYSTKNFPGLTGNLTCSPAGDCADPYIAVYRYHTGQFPPEKIWPQTVSTISPESGGTVTSYHGDATVQIPAGAVTETTVITYLLAHGPLPGGNLTDVGHIFDLTAVYVGTGQPAQIAPGYVYTITVQYTNTETDKIMESALGLYYWDGSQWVEEPTSRVDIEHNTVTATPNHFSRWAVLAEMWQIYLPLVTKTR